MSYLLTNLKFWKSLVVILLESILARYLGRKIFTAE